MKIYDAFTFYNETEILALRLKELNDKVDRFYVVEGDCTFTGRPKSVYFEDTDLSRLYEDKITSIKCELTSKDPWNNEIHQRNTIGTIDYGDANSLVIISDVDEIPNMDTVLKLDPRDLPVQLDVTQYFWNLNWQVPQHCNQGARPVVALARHLSVYTPQELRASTDLRRIENGGWHFSFFGETTKNQNKIESFAHTEYNLPEYKDAKAIQYRIDNGIDPFDRFPLKYTEIDETYPASFSREQNTRRPHRRD